ncbi:hypothetical protein C0995_009114 [Termitomyces sp. Mi166|nr:hypothetical protein C0995_009114 [Termitomyces sp. Mi166\
MSSTPQPVLPPVEGLFIPDAIDFNIKNNPEQPFFTFADPKAPTGLQVITHLEFGRAAHRVAHALRPNRAGEDGQVVAIFRILCSIRQSSQGALSQPFPISPRNAPTTVVNLLEKTLCHRLITTNSTLKALIDGIRAQIANISLADTLQIEEVLFASVYPNLGHEPADQPFNPFPGPPTCPSEDDICIILHSSGSTGFPKAIPQTHRA